MSDPPSISGGSAALTFAALDDHAIACVSAERPLAPPLLLPDMLGPQVEYLILAQQGTLSAMRGSSFADAVSCAVPNRLLELGDGTVVLRLAHETLPEIQWTRLSIRAKQAAIDAGFPRRNAGQLAVALEEMMSNVMEHSGAAHTGLVAFRGSAGIFEFVVADQGIGALASLRRNPQFAELANSRDALPRVLQTGCTSTGDPERGRGFDDLFRGLANHNGLLRFRSGDAAVVIDGQSPSPLRPKVKRRAAMKGFLAAVSCMA
ncbi:MAG: ATP-binding protein [Hyphomicrobiaceae bacterium]